MTIYIDQEAAAMLRHILQMGEERIAPAEWASEMLEGIIEYVWRTYTED